MWILPLTNTMWDFAVRFSFGQPTQCRDAEEGMNVETAPLLAGTEGANNRPILRGFDGAWQEGNHDGAMDIDDNHAPHAAPQAASHASATAFADTHLHHIATQSLAALTATITHSPLFQSLDNMKHTQKRRSSKKGLSQPDSNVHPSGHDVGQADNAPSTGSGPHTAPDAQHMEHTLMETVLSPVGGKLQHLKATTLDSLLPYNPRLRSNSYAQVLKIRLLPVGEYIVRLLARSAAENRGTHELKLCRHIATEYWPLPITDTTHLRIQEMYRNTLFRRTPRVPQETQCDLSAGEEGSLQAQECDNTTTQIQPEPVPSKTSDSQHDAQLDPETMELTRNKDG
ncbi:hypothetical protein N0V83_009467 [Neocucurbitaria cava]|uniref:Chromodomain-helicase-DNA-binding protein 1-like C-terminal domain-containing protein n=1 Tax=Neocucurbitaria cava TaxID=798079 RepID=A0A9W8Y0M3_9PLEO|nr:hypothetical protein N0V83_009467 [Neocucurbitaria cava]